jgi:hypothetical protein
MNLLGENMKLLKNLAMVIVIAATGAMGAAQAQTSPDPNLGTLTPTVTERTDFFASGSFADTFNFTIDAAHHMFTGSTVTFSPAGVDATQTHVTNLQFELFDGTGTLLFTGLDLSTSLDPGNFSARISGTADGLAGGGFQFSVAANPEPAEWMLLLCGLVVAGFIARRKMGLGLVAG